MDYIASNLSKLIKNSPIDIDAVNEFLKRGNKNLGLIIKENGNKEWIYFHKKFNFKTFRINRSTRKS